MSSLAPDSRSNLSGHSGSSTSSIFLRFLPLSFFPLPVTHPNTNLYYQSLYLCDRHPHSCHAFPTRQSSSNADLIMEAPPENLSMTANFTKHIIQTVCYRLQGSLQDVASLPLRPRITVPIPSLACCSLNQPRCFSTQGLCACCALCLTHYSPNLLTFQTSASMLPTQERLSLI